jgi:hypothetical protein
MSAILQIWCQIYRTFSVLRYVNSSPEIYNAITVPHIMASIFKWTYLRCYWWYLVNSMRVMLQTRCQIQRTTTSLRNVNCGPGHIKCIYSSAYSGWNIQLHVSALPLEISPQFSESYTAIWVRNKGTFSRLRYVNCGPGHIQCIYGSAYSDFNIQLNVLVLLLEISRQFNARYTTNLVPNTAHIVHFKLCVL